MKLTKKELQEMIQEQTNRIIKEDYYSDRQDFSKQQQVSQQLVGILGQIQQYLQNHPLEKIKVNVYGKSLAAEKATKLLKNVLPLLDQINS